MTDRPCSYAPLALIRAAFCPLEFNARKLGEHPQYHSLPYRDTATSKLEVGESLIYPRQFPFTDANKHRKIGTQIVTAPFGFAPVDFDMLLGIFDHLKRCPEQIGKDRTVRMTAYFIGRLSGLPTTSTDNINRIRSRVFRTSYVKYTNTASWNSVLKRYEDLSNFDFFSISSMSRLTESRRPITIRLSDEFVRMLKQAPCVVFSRERYRGHSEALRRLYLIADRDGWRSAHSTIFDADMFCVHQLGYAADPDPVWDRKRKRDRLAKLRRLLKQQAEREGLVRPYPAWRGYFSTLERGPLKGRLALRLESRTCSAYETGRTRNSELSCRRCVVRSSTAASRSAWKTDAFRCIPSTPLATRTSPPAAADRRRTRPARRATGDVSEKRSGPLHQSRTAQLRPATVV